MAQQQQWLAIDAAQHANGVSLWRRLDVPEPAAPARVLGIGPGAARQVSGDGMALALVGDVGLVSLLEHLARGFRGKHNAER
jgi:hypothetical protein